MRFVVVSRLDQPVSFLESVGYQLQRVKPETITDIATSDPDFYGQEVVDRYLQDTYTSNKKSTILCLESFLTYRQRALRPPKYKMDALKTLTMLSGHTFSLVTYWLLKQPAFKDPFRGVSETNLTLKKISPSHLTGYVNSHNVTRFPLILDFTDSQTYLFIKKLDGSLNNFLHFIPIEDIQISNNL